MELLNDVSTLWDDKTTANWAAPSSPMILLPISFELSILKDVIDLL